MRTTRVVLAVVLYTLALVALGAPVAAAASAAGGTLTYQLSWLPPGIDPLSAPDDAGEVVIHALFAGLTGRDATTSAVVPAAARSWESDPGAKVWTFHLREGATYSNGAPVTAQDFKASWERLLTTGATKGWATYLLMNVKGATKLSAGTAKHLSGVVARDKTTLVVTLTAPFADFPSMVATPALGPVPHALVSTAEKARQYHRAPVGNGPFMLAEPWDKEDTISLVASPSYAGTKPHIAGITFTVVEDPAAACEQFKAGVYDVSRFPAASLAEVEAAYGTSADGFAASPGHQVVKGPRAGVLWVAFNTKMAPFEDVRVRRAFSLALDRTKLSSSVAPATELMMPASDMLSPGVPGYAPGQWLYAKLDLTQAAALLAEAGFAGGSGLPEITFLTSDQATKAEYKTQLAAIGVKVKFVEVSPAKFFPTWRSGKYMMCQEGWNTATATPGEALYNLFYGPVDMSDSFYDDPAVNDALRQACSTLDEVARVAAFKSIDATVGAAAPVTPVAWYGRPVVCSARLQDAVLDPVGLFDFTAVRIE